MTSHQIRASTGATTPAPIEPIVLVVDDDAAVLHSLRFALETDGLRVHLFRSSEALLQETAFPSVGCLVIDYQLPARDGLQALALLRARGVRLPAILITTNPPASVRRRAAAAGVTIIEKPFLGNALSDAIRRTLESRQAVGTGD